MRDVFTKVKRSEVMSRIRSHGNKDTELALARLLRANRITGWRRQVLIRIAHRPSSQDGVKVRPDFIFPKFKLAIFVDGCFWHGCPRHATQPKSNRRYWREKLEANRRRDRRVNRTLRAAGWKVMRIWECSLTKRRRGQTLNRVIRMLQLADQHERP